MSEPSPSTKEPVPPPPLEPLFTLLTNTTSGTTIHPRVQYLFSDDDTSVLSDPSQRAVVVDLVPSPDHAGWSVSWASSLSPDFALTDSHIVTQQDDKSSMLRLEVVEREPVDASHVASLPSSAGSGAALAAREDVHALVDEFRARMDVLKKVVSEDQKRRSAAAESSSDAVEQERPGQEEEQSGTS